ncbi:Twin-arginine translocation protein TatA/E [mine drainage metagenome]|uniref:Twin-arginine translocation protein TatA/E n=1 Tax=mine drainage metagenome TaxID=410659 RepID=T0ZQB8_9ZZZZ
MFDSPTDWIIIIVLVLVLFGGAKKIPEFARSLGKATGEFTRGKMELEREIKSSFASSTPAQV